LPDPICPDTAIETTLTFDRHRGELPFDAFALYFWSYIAATFALLLTGHVVSLILFWFLIPLHWHWFICIAWSVSFILVDFWEDIHTWLVYRFGLPPFYKLHFHGAISRERLNMLQSAVVE
jgi:hypothetical protein